MAIVSTDLKWYKSLVVNDLSTNGGRMSTNEAITAASNNVWPDVPKSERDAGSTKYRKIFAKAHSDNDDTLVAPNIWNDKPTPAGDYQLFFEGTQIDTQATLSESRIYGVGDLVSDVVVGGSTLIVNVEDAALTGIFQDTDKIRITDKLTPSAVTGNEGIYTINGTPSISTTQVTITITPVLANDYLAASTRVMSLFEPGNLAAEITGLTITSAGGTYDDTTYPFLLNNQGAVFENVTLEFTDATNFTATGDTLGALGSGTIGSDFTVMNATYSKILFTIESAGWGGTYAALDTVEFTVNPAAIPLWLKRVVPAGSSSLANNSNLTAISGESV